MASTVAFLFLLSVAQATDYKLGLLIPLKNAHFTMQGDYYASAISIAVDDINKQENMLPGNNISFIWNETNCLGEGDENKTVRALLHQMYEEKVSAIIGPGCNCNTSARIAAAFNVPMISYMCSSPELSNKKLYSTFVRTYAQASKLPKYLLMLLNNYKWSNVGILFEKDWLDTKDSITKRLKLGGINIRVEEELPDSALLRKEYQDKVKQKMELIKDQARIIIIVAEFHIARESLLPAREVGLTNGDYAFILFLLNHDDILVNREFPSFWSGIPTYSEPYLRCKFQQAFDSVLVMALNVNENKGMFKKFQRAVQKRSPEAPFNSQAYMGHLYNDSAFPLKNETAPPVYAAFLYDAVYQYAVALNSTIARNETPDGKNIISKLLNKEYESIRGGRVYIDKNGDAEVEMTLLDMRWQYTIENCPANANNTATLVPVGDFTIHYDNNSDLQLNFALRSNTKILWPGGEPPKDSPECGYGNELCSPPKSKDTAESGETSEIPLLNLEVFYLGWFPFVRSQL